MATTRERSRFLTASVIVYLPVSPILVRTVVYLACVLAIVACIAIGLGTWYGRGASAESGTISEVKETTIKPSPSDDTDFSVGTAPWENLHLPCYTVPRHYELTLYPDFYGQSSTFYGNVTIEIDVKQATYHLLVHIKDLTVNGMAHY